MILPLAQLALALALTTHQVKTGCHVDWPEDQGNVDTIVCKSIDGDDIMVEWWWFHTHCTQLFPPTPKDDNALQKQVYAVCSDYPPRSGG